MVTVGVKCICGGWTMDFRSLGSDILKYMFNKWIELGKSDLADYDVLDVSIENFEKNHPILSIQIWLHYIPLRTKKPPSLSLSLSLMQTQHLAKSHTHTYL